MLRGHCRAWIRKHSRSGSEQPGRSYQRFWSSDNFRGATRPFGARKPARSSLSKFDQQCSKVPKEEPSRVHISAVERDGWSIFSVVDNGIGVDREFANQIFGLFKRLHTRDKYPGSGIGLAICQRIVEQYGGRIWLEELRSRSGIDFLLHFSNPISITFLEQLLPVESPKRCLPFCWSKITRQIYL